MLQFLYPWSKQRPLPILITLQYQYHIVIIIYHNIEYLWIKCAIWQPRSLFCAHFWHFMQISNMQISSFYILTHKDKEYSRKPYNIIPYMTCVTWNRPPASYFLLKCSSHVSDPVATVTRPQLNNGHCLTPQTCTFILYDILLHNYMHIFFQYHVTVQK